MPSPPPLGAGLGCSIGLSLALVALQPFHTLAAPALAAPGTPSSGPSASSPRPSVPGSVTPDPSNASPPQARLPLTGLVTIESDLQKADNTTGVITASGNVRIVYSDRGVVATSRQAQYFSREGRVVLSGDVEVLQEGGNRLQADRVVYLVEQERLVAHPEAGGQVTSRLRIPSPRPATPSTPAAPEPVGP